MGKRILILDDPAIENAKLNTAIQAIAGEKSYVHIVSSREALFQVLKADDWELVVIDHTIEGKCHTGLEVLAQLRKDYPNLPVVVVLSVDDINHTGPIMEAGAADVLLQGPKVDISSQLKKVARLMRLIETNRELKRNFKRLHEAEMARFKMIGNSKSMQEIVQIIERVAHIPRPVLIKGPRGSGKELVARAIHDAGNNPQRPMITVNCAAFTDELLDSTLFGHEKGAFTGANQRFLGKFEQASGGTLFLDEIGHMSKNFQQKILRAVEYGTIRRIGGHEDIQVNTRVIAATNADLEEMMDNDEFLRDLYDRLTFDIIKIPPLKERKEDIPVLAQHFLEQFTEEIPAFKGKKLSQSAIETLQSYAFPGNIRELKNIIERAVYRDTTNEITPEDIFIYSNKPQDDLFIEGENLKEKVENFELKLINQALEESVGNQAEAARRLGISYSQFRYYVKKYDDRLNLE